ncbi:hypothetical protein sscle_14g098600 [Sclerotinia sclerotiorum 1980 UF-70]|nr:hypothetical protein sscle_14g098600 [Sclerotinia sclerotiorum 1980 UF-70]
MDISTLSKSILSVALTSNITTSIATNFTYDLQPLLSSSAEIYYPGSEGYINATTRWDAYTKPGLDVVVKVACEEDVQETIRYANSHSVPFLAISGGHATSSTLLEIKSGIGIYLRGLSGVSISPTDKSQALILGGTLSGEVISELWDLGKQTATGACDCVGFISPVLGGGHGWLEGRYGLMADNLISARVVLANGTAVTVDNTQHSDLFWGLRGAGHNFGIVTSIYYQIYDRTPDIDSFATATFTFTQDRLEEVFSIANQWLAAKYRPVELMYMGLIAFDPIVDSKPIVQFQLRWQGADNIPDEYTDPLNALNPVSVIQSHISLLNINALTGASPSGPACVDEIGRQLFPTDLDSWNVASLRAVLDIFSTFPASFSNSLMLLEGYATNRVLEIPSDSTAYALRSKQLLAAPFFTYPPNDETLQRDMIKLGKQIRNVMLNGTGEKLHAYVNYATGDESQEALYGYEPWRLERLRKLKKEYDPLGRFNFFGPIKM